MSSCTQILGSKMRKTSLNPLHHSAWQEGSICFLFKQKWFSRACTAESILATLKKMFNCKRGSISCPSFCLFTGISCGPMTTYKNRTLPNSICPMRKPQKRNPEVKHQNGGSHLGPSMVHPPWVKALQWISTTTRRSSNCSAAGRHPPQRRVSGLRHLWRDSWGGCGWELLLIQTVYIFFLVGEHGQHANDLLKFEFKSETGSRHLTVQF